VVSHRGQSSWSVLRGLSVVFVVVVSRRGQLFFVVCRYSWSVSVLLGRRVSLLRGHSSWSMWSVVVVSRFSWMEFIFYGGYAHVFTEAHGWGKPTDL